METNDSKTPVDKFIAEVRSLKPRFGCSDINCPFRNNTLGTNGGCRCLRDLRAVLTQRDHLVAVVEAARGALDDWDNHWHAGGPGESNLSGCTA
jgi:hypothetical protein